MAHWRDVLVAADGDFGVIGDPVDHSLSPFMQAPALEAWARSQGRPLKPRYLRIHVPAADLPEFMTAMHDSGLAGINVTVPHKETIVDIVRRIAGDDALDLTTQSVGAANTIEVEDGAVRAYNTDGIGFMRALTVDLGIKPKSALVLGAGGTGQVIVHHLLQAGVSVNWWNRTRKRVDAAMRTIGAGGAVHVVGDTELMAFSARAELLVNATSVGLKDGDGLPAAGLRFSDKQAAFDVVYHRHTEFLRQAKAAGARACGGLPMLLYQGAESFRIWTGTSAPVDTMKEALLKAVREKGIEPVWPSVT